MKRTLILSIGMAGLLLLASRAGALTTNVTVSSFLFTPNTVNISTGDTVHWVNNSGILHDSTRSSSPMTWTSGDMSGSGGTFNLTFNSAGTFAYVCNRHIATHPEMNGSVVVTAAANPPPTVSITNPANNTVFSAPANVTVGATASDNGSVTNVQFLVGSVIIGNDTTLPYSATTNGLPVGTYTLSAIASDNLGAKATNSISITVNSPPSVTVTNPADNAVFSAPASVTIQATASDNGSVTNVQFLVGTAVVGNDTTLPYSATTNGLPAGSYTLSAIASDNLGFKATNSINITVNAANLPPSVTITNPGNNTVFAAPANVTIQATASDDGSVTNVQFVVGSAIIGNDTTLPYSATTNGLPAGTYTVSAVASDNLGTTATNSISIIVNAAPSVSLTNPVNNAKFRAPATILLQASASDSDGSVTNVQFFSGGTPFGNDNTAPFSFSLSNVSAGNYSFSAVAADNRGTMTTSAVNNVSVLTNAILTTPSRLPGGQFQFTVLGIAGQTYATEGSANLTNWLPIITNVAPANTFNVTDFTSTNVLLRYYRARQDL